ncbi:MAG: glutaredoxin domain-containing protein [Bacteroidales bacterium]
MKITEVRSQQHLQELLQGRKRAFLLLYKAGTDNSDCALTSIRNARVEHDDTLIMAANVAEVRDIHTYYGVKSAPTLMRFENGVFKSEIKGCHEPRYYGSLIENAVFTATASTDGQPKHRVTVYSTPSCPHCTSLKTHLKHHGIAFRDVDVSKDQQKAQELVRRTGQQGVPQAEINGQWVLGFDKTKVNKLLGI